RTGPRLLRPTSRGARDQTARASARNARLPGHDREGRLRAASFSEQDTEEIQRGNTRTMNSRACHAIFAVLCLILFAAGCGGNGSSSTMPPGPLPEYKIIDLASGAGASPHAGDRITVNYTGWLYDRSKPDNKGKQFD